MIKQFLKKRKLKKELKFHDKPFLEKPIEIYETEDYNFKIKFANKEELEGTVTVNKIDDLADVFLNNKYSCFNDNEKFVYYNSNNIIFFEATKIKKGEQ